MENFHVYLTGQEFTVVTDHRLLEWLQQMKYANARLTWWSLFCKCIILLSAIRRVGPMQMWICYQKLDRIYSIDFNKDWCNRRGKQYKTPNNMTVINLYILIMFDCMSLLDFFALCIFVLCLFNLCIKFNEHRYQVYYSWKFDLWYHSSFVVICSFIFKIFRFWSVWNCD